MTKSPNHQINVVHKESVFCVTNDYKV